MRWEDEEGKVGKMGGLELWGKMVEGIIAAEEAAAGAEGGGGEGGEGVGGENGLVVHVEKPTNEEGITGPGDSDMGECDQEVENTEE
jgi:hypothetical protein